jgi:glycosyltransferase involved in cell wall biosynthesis
MPLEVCFAYPWATFGGVERVFLNRASAFRDAGMDIAIDVFYGADGGGLEAFRRTIDSMELSDILRITPDFEPGAYDAVFLIDYPQLLAEPVPGETSLIAECHTPYPENRVYLDSIPDGLAAVVVPSATFARTLQLERPQLEGRIRVLANCLASLPSLTMPTLPAWTGLPLLFFGRLDDLKNAQGFVDLIARMTEVEPDSVFGIVVGPQVPEFDFERRVRNAGLEGRVSRLPPMNFMRTQSFLESWRNAGGIMVSPSRGESFGLAAAEAIAAGVPVLLSDLPEHRVLVQGDDRHLYPADDLAEGASKILAMASEYKAASRRMIGYAGQFGAGKFLKDWSVLMDILGCKP